MFVAAKNLKLVFSESKNEQQLNVFLFVIQHTHGVDVQYLFLFYATLGYCVSVYRIDISAKVALFVARSAQCICAASFIWMKCTVTKMG